MNADQWFYSEAGGETQGPLPVETIRAAVAAGRLGERVNLSRQSNGPWAPLKIVERLGDGAFGTGAARRIAKAERSIARGNAKAGGSVAGFVEIVGWLMVGGGVLGLAGFLATMAAGSSASGAQLAGALSALVSGLMFLATAEALRRLGDIAASLRQR